MFVEHRFSQIAGDRGLVVGVRGDDEDVSLEPWIGWRIGGLLAGRDVGERDQRKQLDRRKSTRPGAHLHHFSSVNAELLTKASRLPSGDQEGTLIVPCPPYTYAITRGRPPLTGISRSSTCL